MNEFSFENKGEIKPFSDKQELKELVPSRGQWPARDIERSLSERKNSDIGQKLKSMEAKGKHKTK